MAAESRNPLVGGARHSDDFYTVLRVDRNASGSDLRSAYRRAVLHAHPDRGGSSEAFCLVTKAFETLSNPSERSLYDKSLEGDANYKTGGSSNSRCKRRPTSEAGHNESGAGRGTKVPEESLTTLHEVLREMDKPMRDQEISKMHEGVRTALLKFMEERRSLEKPVHREPVYAVGSSCMRLRSFRDSIGREKFSVQLDVDSLRAYTRQVPLETAIEHQLVLSDLRDHLLEAEASFWKPPFKICQVFQAVLSSHTTTVCTLGLSIFVQMRASEWIPNAYSLTSPVMGFDETVALRHRLITARATSWAMLRQAWVALLQARKHSMTAGDASVYVDKAREELLRRRLVQATTCVELTQKQEPASKTSGEGMQTHLCRKKCRGLNSTCLTAAALRVHTEACASRPCSDRPFANLAETLGDDT